MNWGKGNNQIFQGLLDTGSKQTLISGILKCHSGLPVRKEAWRSGDQWCLGEGLSHRRPNQFLNIPVDISSMLKNIIEIDILSNQKNPNIGSLTHGITWQGKPSGSHQKSAYKNTKQTQYCRYQCHQGLERCGGGDSYYNPVQLVCLACAEDR